MQYFSFKNTLLDFAKGIINPTLQDKFIFNCHRNRVFNEGIPGYVALLDGKEISNDTILKEQDISQEAYQKWLALKDILLEADRQENIIFLREENCPYFGQNINELYQKTPEWSRHGLTILR